MWYAECYQGNGNLTETVPTGTLTGTLSFSPSSKTVTGVGTDFVSECHLGQMILADSEVLVVDVVVSPTSFLTTRTPTTTSAGAIGYRLPNLFPMDKQRGALLSGNALIFDQGTILFLGSGTLYVNGAQLTLNSGSWAATAQAKLGIYDPTNNWYDVYTLGMTPTGAWSAAAVAGGTRNMAAGTYSLQIVPAKTQAGWNNPLDPYASVIIATGQKVRVTFPAMDTTNGQNAWRVYVTGWDPATPQTLFKSGPWYYFQTVTATDLGGTGAGTTFDFEWLDTEVTSGEILQFDNDDALDAEFVTAAPAGYPVYVSCQGKGTPTQKNGSNPGPSILPTRPGNIEASPLTGIVPLSPPETIIGFKEAAGRLYLMTPNSLPIGVFTANPNFPITIRPFWKVGFKNPDALAFVNDFLYGYTTNGMTRSIATGDEAAASSDFALDVKEITATWNPGFAKVAYDEQNESICFFQSAIEKNGAGWWVTDVLVWSLQLNAWHPSVFRLSSETGDMIVSGVATVDGYLQFIAGGRQDIGGVTMRTYQWNVNDGGVPVEWYQLWQLDNAGSENRDKTVRSALVTGKLTAAQMDIYTFGAGQVIDVAAMEAGTGSASGAIPLTDSTDVTEYARVQLKCNNANMLTSRIGGTWDGLGTPDRVDEVVLETSISGVRR